MSRATHKDVERNYTDTQGLSHQHSPLDYPSSTTGRTGFRSCYRRLQLSPFWPRILVASRLALATFTATLFCLHPTTHDELLMPFLGVVIAVYANGSTVGASCRMAVDAVRGICYCSFAASISALLFGHSRLAVGLMLFFTCVLFMIAMGPSMPPLQRKLFLGYNAYLFLVHVRNPDLQWYYSFKILYSALIGASTAVAASLLPFPLTASAVMQAHAHRAMLHTARLYYVITKAMFSITNEQYDTGALAQLVAQQQQQAEEETLGSPAMVGGTSIYANPGTGLYGNTGMGTHTNTYGSDAQPLLSGAAHSDTAAGMGLRSSDATHPYPYPGFGHAPSLSPQQTIFLPPGMPREDSAAAAPSLVPAELHATFAQAMLPPAHATDAGACYGRGHHAQTPTHTHRHGYGYGYGYGHTQSHIYDDIAAHAHAHAHGHPPSSATAPPTHSAAQSVAEHLHAVANDLARVPAPPVGKGVHASVSQSVHAQPPLLSSAITNTTALTSPFAQLLLMEARGLVDKVEEEIVAAMAMIDDLHYESWVYRLLYRVFCCRCREAKVTHDEYGNPQPDATYPLFGSWRGAYGAPYSAQSAQSLLSHLSALGSNARGMASGVEALTKLDYNGTLLLHICSLYLKPYAEDVCAQVRAFVLMLVDKNADTSDVDGPFLRDMLRSGSKDAGKHAHAHAYAHTRGGAGVGMGADATTTATPAAAASSASTAPGPTSAPTAGTDALASASPFRVVNAAYVFEDLFALFGPKQPHPALYKTAFAQAGTQSGVGAGVEAGAGETARMGGVSVGVGASAGDLRLDTGAATMPSSGHADAASLQPGFFAPSSLSTSTSTSTSTTSSPPSPLLFPSGSYAAALHALYAMWFAYSTIRKRVFDNARIEHAKARVYAEIANFRVGAAFDASVLARYVLDDGHRGTVLSPTGALRPDALLRTIPAHTDTHPESTHPTHFSRTFSGQGPPGLLSPTLVRTTHGTLVHLDRFHPRFATLVVHGEYHCPATDALMFPAAVRAALAPHLQPATAHAHHSVGTKVPVPPHFRIQDLLSLNHTLFNADRFLTRLLHKVAPQVYVHLNPLTVLATTMPLALAYPNDQFAGYDIFAQTRVGAVEEDEEEEEGGERKAGVYVDAGAGAGPGPGAGRAGDAGKNNVAPLPPPPSPPSPSPSSSHSSISAAAAPVFTSASEVPSQPPGSPVSCDGRTKTFKTVLSSPTSVTTLALRVDTAPPARASSRLHPHAVEDGDSPRTSPLDDDVAAEVTNTSREANGPLVDDNDAVLRPFADAEVHASSSSLAAPLHPTLHSTSRTVANKHLPLPPPSFPSVAPTPAYYLPPPLFPAAFFADILMPHALTVAVTFFRMIFCPATSVAIEATTADVYGASKVDNTICRCAMPEWVPVFTKGEAVHTHSDDIGPGSDAVPEGDIAATAALRTDIDADMREGAGTGKYVGAVNVVLPDIPEASEEEEGRAPRQPLMQRASSLTVLPGATVAAQPNVLTATSSGTGAPGVHGTGGVDGVEKCVCLHCSACGCLAPTSVQISLLGRQYVHYEEAVSSINKNSHVDNRDVNGKSPHLTDNATNNEAATTTAGSSPSYAPGNRSMPHQALAAVISQASETPSLKVRIVSAVKWLLLASSADFMRYRHCLKISIAIGIASLLALIPGPVYFVSPYWAPLTIGFVFSDNVGSGFLTAFGRLQGTLLGATFGYVTGMISEQVDPSYGTAYAYTCSCLLTAWALACGYVRTGTTHVYAASVAVFTAVAIAIGIGKDYGRYAFARVEMTICGIVIVLFVMTFLWPERAGKDDFKRIANVLKESVVCLELNFHLLHMSSVDEVEQTLRGADAAATEAAQKDKHTSDKLSYRLYGPSLLPGVNVDVVAKGRVTLGAALENIKARFARAQERERRKQAVLGQLRDVHTRYTYTGTVRVAGDVTAGSVGGRRAGEGVDGGPLAAPLVSGGFGGGDVTLPMDSEEFQRLLAANRARNMPGSPLPSPTLPQSLSALQQNPFGAASVIRLFFSSLFPNIPLPESPAQFMVIYNRTIEHKLTNMRTQVIVQRRLALEAQAEPILCGRNEAPTALLFEVIEHQVKLIRTLSRMQECLFLHQWCLQRMEGKHALADELLAWKRTEDERRLQLGLSVRDKAWGRDLLRDIGIDAYQVTRQQATDAHTSASRKPLPRLVVGQGRAAEDIDYRALDPEHYSNTFVEHTTAPAPSILDVVAYRDTLAPHAQEADGHGAEYSVSMSHSPAHFTHNGVQGDVGAGEDMGVGANDASEPSTDVTATFIASPFVTQHPTHADSLSPSGPLPPPPRPPTLPVDGSIVSTATHRHVELEALPPVTTRNTADVYPDNNNAANTTEVTSAPASTSFYSPHPPSHPRVVPAPGSPLSSGPHNTTTAPLPRRKRVARYPTIYNFAELAASACSVLSALVDDVNRQVESASDNALKCSFSKGRLGEMCCCDDVPDDGHCSCSDDEADTDNEDGADADEPNLVRLASATAAAAALETLYHNGPNGNAHNSAQPLQRKGVFHSPFSPLPPAPASMNAVATSSGNRHGVPFPTRAGHNTHPNNAFAAHQHLRDTEMVNFSQKHRSDVGVGRLGSPITGTGSSILRVYGLGGAQEDEEVAALVRENDYEDYDVTHEVDAATHRRVQRKREERDGKRDRSAHGRYAVTGGNVPVSSCASKGDKVSRDDYPVFVREEASKHPTEAIDEHKAIGSLAQPTTAAAASIRPAPPAADTAVGGNSDVSGGFSVGSHPMRGGGPVFKEPIHDRGKRHRPHCHRSPFFHNVSRTSQAGTSHEWVRERVRVRHLYAILLRLMSGYEHACRHRVVARASGDHALMYPSLFLLTEHAFMESTMRLSNVLMQLTLTIRALHLATSVWRK